MSSLGGPGCLHRRSRRVPWTEDDPDVDWRIEPDESSADIVALYQGEIAQSRQIVAGLDDNARIPEMDRPVSYLLPSMIQEASRHDGHAGILGERLRARQLWGGDDQNLTR